MRTLSEIIKDAGGAKAISEASEGTVKIDAIYKWPTIGIQDRHWPLIMRLVETTPEELFEANIAARTADPTPTEAPVAQGQAA